MKKNLSNFKNIFMTLAIMLTFSASAWALEINYTGPGQYKDITSFPSGYDIIVNVPDASWTCYLTVSATNQWKNSKFIKKGAGKLVLVSFPAYTYNTIGVAQIEAGIYESCGRLLTITGANVLAGATFRMVNPDQELGYNISGGGTFEFSSGSTYYDYKFTGNISTTKTNILKGGLIIGNNGTTGTITGTVTVSEGAWIGFYRSNDYTCTAVINGKGSVSKWTCNGTITLNAACNYEGYTDIWGGGAFTLGANGTIEKAQGVYLTENNSVFNINSWKRIKRLGTWSGITGATINISSAGTLCVGSSNGADGGGTYAGKIIGAGKFHKDGSETLTLTGNNTYTGETGIYWGTVVFSTGSLGTGNIYFRGALNATLRWADGNSTDISARLKTDKADAPITFDIGKNHVTFANPLPTITGTITKASTGSTSTTLTLLGTQTYTGKTVVAGGDLDIGNATSNGHIGTTSEVEVKSGARLYFRGTGTTIFDKKITGAGSVNCLGAANKVVKLTANNDYTGGTQVYADNILYVGNNTNTGAIGTGNLVTNSGSSVEFRRTNDYTYSGVISGAGSIHKYYGAKLILTGANTYTGATTVKAGTLQIGNGTNGSIATTSGVTIDAGAVLRFEPGASMKFEKQITGGGSVEKGPGGELILTANNNYSGTTKIEAGILAIGDNTATGAIAGNIINNGLLDFRRNNAYTYSGIISGTGQVYVNYGNTNGTITFDKAHTYNGETYIFKGSLVLAAAGTIATSTRISLENADAKLNISAGDKTIKGLSSTFTTAEVVLGAKTLTINGGGNYAGKFSGTGGGVTKTGTELFAMTGNNTATGLFSLDGGKLQMASWGGNFKQATGTTLDIKGTTTVGGTLTLQGGEITMDLTSATPSKINALGAVYASGKTKLTIATGTVTNKAIMQAASGLTPSSVDFFTLNIAGFTGTLTANGTELLLTVNVTDNTPPTPGAGVNGTADLNSATLSWGAAQDNITPVENLRYFVYQSSSNNLNNPANCETNGTLLNAGGTMNLISYNVPGLAPDATYYFNVVVADQAGNKAAYTTKQLSTSTEMKVISVTVSPNTATLSPGQYKQFTATVVATGGASESITWSILNGNSSFNYISSDGMLIVSGDETATSIKVRATSNFDPTVYGEATITIIPVGITTNSLNNQITVYPNPTSGELTIDNGELTIKNVEVYDMAGKKLFVEQNSYGLTILRSYDLTHFPAGTYFVKITTEQGIVTKKVIKQ